MREILIILTISVVFSMLSCSVETKKGSGNDGDILLDDSDTAETDELVSADSDIAETDESINADGDVAETDEVTSSDGDIVETDDDLGVPDDFVDEDDVDLNDENDESPDLSDDNSGMDDDLSDEDIDLLPPDTNHTTVLFGTDKNDFGTYLAMDSAGNIYMAGNTEGNLDGQINSGEQDAFLMKFDSYGNKLWTKLYGTEKIDSGNYIKIDSSGNIYLTGYTAGTFNDNISKGSYDAFLMKLDKDGEVLWVKQIGTSGADTSGSIVFDNDGNIYISGYVDGSTEGTIDLGTPDAFIAKFTSDGTELWLKRWGSEGFDITYRSIFHDEFIYIIGATNGDVGGSGFFGGMYDTFLTKVDTSGNISWTKQWGTIGAELSYSFTINDDSNFFLCGSASGMIEDIDLNNMGISMTKLDGEGDFEWTDIWKSGKWQGANSIISDESGNFYLSGFSLGNLDGYENSGEVDTFLIKVDSSGNKIWTKLFGGEGTEMSNSTLIDKYGNMYVAGSTESNLDGQTSSGGYDIFLIKFSAEDL